MSDPYADLLKANGVDAPAEDDPYAALLTQAQAKTEPKPKAEPPPPVVVPTRGLNALEQAFFANPANTSLYQRTPEQMANLYGSSDSLTASPQPEGNITNALRGMAINTGVGLDKSRLNAQAWMGDLLDLTRKPTAEGEVLQKDRLRKYDAAQGRADAAKPAYNLGFTNDLYDATTSLAQTAPSLALAVATKNPALGLGLAGMQSADYLKYKERGATVGEASLGAAGEGAVEILTEKSPMGFLVGKYGTKSAKDFISGYLIREGLGEQAATLAQDAIDTAIANPDKTWGDYLKERPNAAYQTALATLVTGGAVSAPKAIAEVMAGTPKESGPTIDDYRALVQSTFAGKPATPPQPQPAPSAPSNTQPAIDALDAIIARSQQKAPTEAAPEADPYRALVETASPQYSATVETAQPVNLAEAFRAVVETPPPRAIVETPSPQGIVETAGGGYGTARPDLAQVAQESGEVAGNQPAERLPADVVQPAGYGMDPAAGDIAGGSGVDLAAGNAVAGTDSVELRDLTEGLIRQMRDAKQNDLDRSLRTAIDRIKSGGISEKPAYFTKLAKEFEKRGDAKTAGMLGQVADTMKAKQKAIPKPAKPPKPKVSGLATKDPGEYGEAARRVFLQTIKKAGGVSIEDAADITGETRVNSSRMSPGFFSTGAPGIDLVARRLHEAGYITDAEYNDTDGGVQVARDLINNALRKQPVLTSDQQERMAELEAMEADAHAELQDQAEQDMLAEILVADLTDAEFSALHSGIPADEAADQTDADRAAQQEQDDGQSSRIESQAGETQPGSTEARAESGQGQPERAAVQGADQAARPELSLAQQTERDLAERERELNQREAEHNARERAALEKEKADRARDDFTLTGSNRASDANAGQGDLLSQPAAKPEPTAAPITDFGEKLGGARKDQAPSLSKELTDDDIASQTLSKLWPAAEIDAIEDKFAAAVAYAARAEVPSKPRVSYKVKRWVESFKMVRELAQMIVSGKFSRDTFMDKLKERHSLDAFAAKVTLLEAIERSQWGRIGAVGEFPQAYRYDGDDKIQTPMVRVEVDGKNHNFDASSVGDVVDRVNDLLTGEAEGKRMQFEVRGRNGSFSINKKGDKEYRKLKTFTSTEEAFAFIKGNYDDLAAAWEAVKDSDNVKKTDVRGAENRPRTGADHRNGKDVTAEQFTSTFGFRGVEFGNWVSQGKNTKERQGMLNQAYDALMDLADIVGIPPKALSLNGSLGLGFGSRGSGAASAHFEPDTLVINLTKTRGAGTLAHEWLHALDNYFSRQRGGEVPIKRGMNAQEAYRTNNYITYRPEPMYVHKTQQRGVPISKAQLARYHELNPKSAYANPDNWQIDPAHPQGVRPEVERAFAELVEALDASPMRKRAESNDKGPDGYWSRIIERAARSFENYVISKMMEKGYDNDYLANVRSVEDFPRSRERYPYLLPEEIAPIAEAFDGLFNTIETKETDSGIAMFSRGNPEAAGNAGAVTQVELDAVIKRVASGWKRAQGDSGRLIAVETAADLPAAILRAAQAQNVPQNEIKGVFHNGHIYLVRDNHTDARAVEETIFHEAYGHYGARLLNGNDAQKLSAAFSDLWKRIGALDGVRKMADKFGVLNQVEPYIKSLATADMPLDTKRRIIVDELLAHIQGRGEFTLKEQAKAYLGALRVGLRNAARAMRLDGIAQALDGYTDAELLLNLKQMREAVVSGNSGKGKGTLFSRIDQTATDAFKKWFGGSKVVDSDGKPLVVYHGTKRAGFTDFYTGNIGAQFTDSSSVAASFAGSFTEFGFDDSGNVIDDDENIVDEDSDGGSYQVYLKITNPKVIEWGGKNWSFELEDLAASAKREGHDGVIIVDVADQGAAGFADSNVSTHYIAFDPTQIKSAIGNNGDFDGNNPDIRFSRTATLPGQPQATRQPSDWRDPLGRMQFAPAVRLKDAANRGIANLVAKSETAQAVYDAFKIAPPKLQIAIRKMKATQQQALDQAGEVAKATKAMTPAEKALVSDIIEGMVKPGVVPPEHIVAVADRIRSIMDVQTDELVKLGMLAKDTADRWRGKYLPRFYNRQKDPALDTWGKKLLKTAMPIRGMGGNSLKARGLFQTINVSEVSKWEALGWEVRDPLWENRNGKLELKQDNKLLNDPDSVQIWRDFNPAERENMGEIRDAVFRFAMGYTAMQNDIALGRMFDAIARNPEWTRPRAEDGYVHVPETEIADTGGVKRYGNLAGLYVRKDIMSHLSQHDEGGEVLKLYRRAMGLWKMGKVPMNPVSHANNTVSNLTMAHLAGVSYWDGHKYAAAMRDFVKGAPMLDEAKETGLLTGDITRAEILSEMPQEIRDMLNMQESQLKKKGRAVYDLMTYFLRKPMLTAYRFEDDFFKYLIYRDARTQGLKPEDAMLYATQYIFNYDDLPKGARAVRDAAIPFFSYTYKAFPALIHAATHYPWRFLAPSAVVGGYGLAVYGAMAALMGGDDDEWDKALAQKEADQKNLAPWDRGKSLFLTDKTFRTGAIDDRTGLPVFMNIYRFLPGGDMLDTGHGESTTLPAPLMPSHPILGILAAMIPQINKDVFTGKELVDKNDTGAEVAKKRLNYLTDALAPAIAPTGYHADRLLNTLADTLDTTISLPLIDVDYTGIGKDGLPVQAKYAIPQTFGVKMRPVDLERNAEFDAIDDRATMLSIKREVRSAKMQMQRGSMTSRQYQSVLTDAKEKINRLRDD